MHWLRPKHGRLVSRIRTSARCVTVCTKICTFNLTNLSHTNFTPPGCVSCMQSHSHLTNVSLIFHSVTAINFIPPHPLGAIKKKELYMKSHSHLTNVSLISHSVAATNFTPAGCDLKTYSNPMGGSTQRASCDLHVKVTESNRKARSARAARLKPHARWPRLTLGGALTHFGPMRM